MEADPDDPRLVLLESASRSRSQEAAPRALRLALRTARDDRWRGAEGGAQKAGRNSPPGGDPVIGARLGGTAHPRAPRSAQRRAGIQRAGPTYAGSACRAGALRWTVVSVLLETAPGVATTGAARPGRSGYTVAAHGRRMPQVPENHTLDHFREWTDGSRANVGVDRPDGAAARRGAAGAAAGGRPRRASAWRHGRPGVLGRRAGSGPRPRQRRGGGPPRAVEMTGAVRGYQRWWTEGRILRS
ncbi:hypothetical protein EDD29_3098 [Actinocorallia herbida]|uniref:Uncharacterized protein n=2 Tax=Actinocorallia herbida TaxID=58109 RepID=A0A3N1CW68_9ACTN|nr:hypothetical protein EDD29_3098 [Actinocorallia herbida]